MFASPDVASCRLRPSRADAPTSIYLASCACSEHQTSQTDRRFGYAHLAYTVCLRTHGHASRQGSHQGTSHPGRAHPSAPRPRLSSASLTDPPPHRTPASTARLAFPGKHSGIHLYRVRRQASCLPFEPQELASIPSAPCRTQRSASIWIICIFRRGPPRRRTTKESLSLCVSVSCPPFRSTATNLAAKRYHLSPTSVATRQVKRPVCCLRAFQRTRRTPEGLSLLALVSDKDRLPLA
ncbi:unnamed protein product [Parajaminaea phylloscopi]